MNIYPHSGIFKWLALFVLLNTQLIGTTTGQTPIKLDDAIEMARKSNRSIQIANQSIAVQEATFEQTKGNFLPYFGIQLTDMVTNNPLNVFGFKLKQEVVEQSDFDPVLLNDPDIRNQFNLSFNAMMPIYNPEAKAEQNAVRSQIKMKASMADRTAQGVELEVIKSYYMLGLALNALEVLEDTYEAAQSNYTIADNIFNQGLMLKSDLLDMNIMVNQSKLALTSAKINVANAQSQFNYVLNTDNHTEYTPTDGLVDQNEIVLLQEEINPNRADFKAMYHGIEAMESMVKSADKSFLPKLKAFGNFELNDEVPFEKNAHNFLVGISLGWDIYKGNMRKTTINKTKAEIAEKQMELERNIAKAKLEIVNTRRSIEDLNAQIELHDLSIAQAEEALIIRKNRFKQGLEKSTDIINAETQLSHKKLARLNSLFELNMKNAYLKFLLN